MSAQGAGRGGAERISAPPLPPPPPPLPLPAPAPARPSQRGEMAAGAGLNIQLLLQAAEYLERRERGTGTPPAPELSLLRPGPVLTGGPRLCLRRSRAWLRFVVAGEGRGGPAAPRQGQEERRWQQVTAGTGAGVGGAAGNGGSSAGGQAVPRPGAVGLGRCGVLGAGRESLGTERLGPVRSCRRRARGGCYRFGGSGKALMSQGVGWAGHRLAPAGMGQ